MSGFDSILFDFDGVLANTEPIHCECWAQVLAPFGIRLEWEDYAHRFVGVDDRKVLQILAHEIYPSADWAELWKCYPAKKELFRSQVLTQPPFHPSLGPFLEDLAARYTLAVVSSSACAEIDPMLTAGGLRHYFRTIVGGENVSHHKPAPDPYLLAVERLQVQRPLVVEDSDAGVASGRAAGLEVLRIADAAEVPAAVMRRLAV